MEIDFYKRFNMWIDNLNPSGIIVVHIETTGLDREEDEILEISIINGLGKVLMNTYVKPTYKKSWENAEKLNRISPSVVFKKGIPEIHELKSKIIEIFDNAGKILFYNADFVLSFLSYKIDLDIEEKEYLSVNENRYNYQNKVEDAMLLFANDYNNGRRSSLLAANNQFNFPIQSRFEPLYDVNAILWLYYSMYEDKKWQRIFDLVENIEEGNYELGLNKFIRVTKKDKSTYWKRRNQKRSIEEIVLEHDINDKILNSKLELLEILKLMKYHNKVV